MMTYQSPFSQRYASDEMRLIWSERARRLTWRRIWVAAADALASAGLVQRDQVDDLRGHLEQIDLARAAQIEAEIGHELMAELKTFAEQAPVGGAILHWGMTSADVQDNADVIRQRAALILLINRLKSLLLTFAARIVETADLAVLGYTHLQPAEPTSFGYRLAGYAQDLLEHLELLARLRANLRGKGLRGVVGTAAGFVEMLAGTSLSADGLETSVMETLGIRAFPITGQTYPRSQDYLLLSAMAGLAASLHKFAFDIRLMQSPGMSLASEPFGLQQVGSSALPFKQNPVQAEKVCSLARDVAASASVAWQNAANTLLERTLDDSANRRRIIPEAFLACDEMLRASATIVEGLSIDEAGSRGQLEEYAPFPATERLLTALVKAGAHRQEMHERLRQHSLRAWEAVRSAKPNPMTDLLTNDTSLLRYLQPARIRELLSPGTYMGLAPARARALAAHIQDRLATKPHHASAQG